MRVVAYSRLVRAPTAELHGPLRFGPAIHHSGWRKGLTGVRGRSELGSIAATALATASRITSLRLAPRVIAILLTISQSSRGNQTKTTGLSR